MNNNNGFVPEGHPLAIPTEITPEENARIDSEFEELITDYKNTRRGDKEELIRRVFQFAREAHGNDRRLSGDPYICHPLAVARIVARDLGLGSTSISAALLHDVVVNCDATFEDIEKVAGERIANLVRGLTRISGGNIRFVTEETSDSRHRAVKNLKEQAENFRNLLLTISEDVRVVLVKIADRLHNMRTLDALTPFKQKRIAAETLYLYAPLADRLGLYDIKTELEDLSLRYEHPEEYKELKRQMQEAEANCALIFTTFKTPIMSLLDDLGLKYTFQYRMKTVYSIWRKIKSKHVSFDEVYDLFAARIVFEPSSPENEKIDCWRIYAAITSIYKLHPERIRDWISHPKPSGYEALQVTVMGPDCNWIEVQIRSERMNEMAEEGMAAHWKYKTGGQSSQENGLDEWINNIKEILDNPDPDATSFLDSIKLNVLSSSIYVFTPTGDLKEMPKEATALDFAFMLHTNIGLKAEAARVNHELVPLSTILESSDQVEIITAEKEHVQPEWLDFATTTKARSKIINYLNHERKRVADEGEKMMRDFLSQDGIELNNDLMVQLLKHYGETQWEDLFYRFGTGELKLDNTFVHIVRPKLRNTLFGFMGSLMPKMKRKKQPRTKATKPAYQKPLDEESVIYDPEEEIQDNKPKSSTIELKGIDGRGLLNTITRVISDCCTANIINIHLECKDGLFKGYITLDTGDPDVIETMCNQLKKIHEIQKAVKL